LERKFSKILEKFHMSGAANGSTEGNTKEMLSKTGNTDLAACKN
jgi:hypothetical protein